MALPGKEVCPGHLTWSAFGAPYPDSVCSSVLDWSETEEPAPVATLCDADDDFRPKDIPCPFCDPSGFIEYQWGSGDEHIVLWERDETPVADDVEIHFHDGKSLWWTATHPERGEAFVLFRSTLDDDETGTA